MASRKPLVLNATNSLPAELPAGDSIDISQLSGVEPAITAGTTAQYWRGDKTWRSFLTDVLASVLTGLSTATNAVITATDTVLVAMGKLQAQITGNASIPAGYIDGLKMVWNSATSISVTSGACYIQGSSAVISFPSTLTLSSLSLSASTWYHLYAYLNAGTPAIELVTTAPATAYNGTARSKTGDTSRRYVGSIITSASSTVLNFLQSNAGIHYQEIESATRTLSNGVATTETMVALSPFIPVTSRVALMRCDNNSATSYAYFGNSVDSAAGPPTSGVTSIRPSQISIFEFPTDASQYVTYWFPASTTAGLYISILGYTYER